MNRYLYSIIVGTTLFVLQLLTTIRSRLEGLNTDSTDFVTKATSDGFPLMILSVLTGYLLLGIAAHATPLLAATKIHSDLSTRGSQSIRRVLNRRGSHNITLLATILLMVIANRAVFPASRGIPHSDLLLIQTASPALSYGLPIVCGIVLVYWLACIAEARARFVALSIAILLTIAWTSPRMTSSASDVTRAQPDIIFIGIDSLRPDHLQSFGYTGAARTPTIDGFIGQSINFERAYTPMARTFVAYMSILSGKYPTRHGARENLYPAIKIDKSVSVAHRLKSAGYATIFAMDESRFANFDQGYGFDKLVTPPPGIFDFLIGDFLDSIGTNLAQLLPYADEWMPHAAGNRAAAGIYLPSMHDAKLAKVIGSVPPNKPLFLVSHYCIAHAPYAKDYDTARDIITPYETALQLADNQVRGALQELKNAGRLRNAIVVMLSDHGEGLGLKKDGWQRESGDDYSEALPINPYFGHGMPAIDESQMHIILAMQRYVKDQPVWPSNSSNSVANLIDIIPTVLTVAGFEFAEDDFDGVSLIDSESPKAIPERPMFVESGISGKSLQKVNINPDEVANEFGQRFELMPDYHLQLRQTDLRQQYKQRGVLLGRFAVSSWPIDALNEVADCWMKLDRINLSTQCLPLNTTDPVISSYKKLLCTHFQDDEEFGDKWCGPHEVERNAITEASSHYE